ncbi:MAG: zinc ribbon domain-containing protein [Anaerolineaceae bacterium]|nr:zinc ribbon domain-containing protein [Anaerolineaceae bacterium]
MEINQTKLKKINIGDSIPLIYDPKKPKIVRVELSKHKTSTEWRGWKPPIVERQKGKWVIQLIIGLILASGFTLLGMIIEAICRTISSGTPIISEISTQLVTFPVIFPVSLLTWFPVAIIWFLAFEKTMKHRRIIMKYKNNIKRSIQYNQEIKAFLIACPHCQRQLIAGTVLCPYCGHSVNLGKPHTIYSGITSLFSGTGFFFSNNNLHSMIYFAVISLLAISILLLGLEDWIFWENIKKSGS